MSHRLVAAFVVLALASGAMWLLPASWGLLSLRWWVPLLGFLIIAFGVIVPAAAQMPRPREKTREEQFNTPDPGPSTEDLERFGDPWKVDGRG
jgi:hypothetical protein